MGATNSQDPVPVKPKKYRKYQVGNYGQKDDGIFSPEHK